MRFGEGGGASEPGSTWWRSGGTPWSHRRAATWWKKVKGLPRLENRPGEVHDDMPKLTWRPTRILQQCSGSFANATWPERDDQAPGRSAIATEVLVSKDFAVQLPFGTRTSHSTLEAPTLFRANTSYGRHYLGPTLVGARPWDQQYLGACETVNTVQRHHYLDGIV